MDKKEIQRKIDSISADRDALERTKNKLTGEIALLLQQIAEAERPKYRHGDFGYYEGTKTPVAIMTRGQSDSPLNIVQEKHTLCRVEPGECSSTYTILGNIFDLLKEWSEDLTKFSVRYKSFELDLEDPDSPYCIAESWFNQVQAEEIWHKLGQMIATLKRKQS